MRRSSSPDLLSRDLFEIPTAPNPIGGSLNFDAQICHTLASMIKACAKDRYQIAADMSRLVGHEVSKHMLDAYTAESRDAYKFPLNYLPAAEVATDSFDLSLLMVSLRGARLCVGEDALLAELGKLEREELRLRERKTALRARLKRPKA